MAIEKSVCRYIVDLVRSTRDDERVALAASPRAALTLYPPARRAPWPRAATS